PSAPASSTDKKLVLCATKTCPKCTMATVFLDKANLAYEKVYVEDNRELFTQHAITEAPTLLVFEGDGVTKITNVSNIKKYIESL
ncbi:MAG: ribonucleoside triphosphate reductase, partial [Clostridia bacterium]|nr:ribonucleoside triphosphate reductase [Clostridia bacterium]